MIAEGKSVVILSPHSDDVPLSIGSFLLSKTLGTSVHVYVVFSLSRFTRFQLGTGSTEPTTGLRMAEERSAARLAGYEVTFMGFPEPFVRPGFENMEQIFDQRPADSDPIFHSVDRALQDLLSSHNGAILAPFGCGGHIDHRIVFESIRSYSAGADGQRPAFYEDLPYAHKLSDADVCAMVSERHGDARYCVHRCSALPSEKLRLLRCYASQLEVNEDRFRTRHASRGERIWVPRSACWLA